MGFFENLFHSGPSADEKIGAKIGQFKKEGVLDYTPEELARIKEEQREAETGFMTSVAGKARPVMKAVLFASALGLASFEKKAEAQPKQETKEAEVKDVADKEERAEAAK